MNPLSLFKTTIYLKTAYPMSECYGTYNCNRVCLAARLPCCTIPTRGSFSLSHSLSHSLSLSHMQTDTPSYLRTPFYEKKIRLMWKRYLRSKAKTLITVKWVVRFSLVLNEYNWILPCIRVDRFLHKLSFIRQLRQTHTHTHTIHVMHTHRTHRFSWVESNLFAIRHMIVAFLMGIRSTFFSQQTCISHRCGQSFENILGPQALRQMRHPQNHATTTSIQLNLPYKMCVLKFASHCSHRISKYRTNELFTKDGLVCRPKIHSHNSWR